jgi:hypothetical protein
MVIEILQELERLALAWDSPTLVAGGLVAVILGLFVWLGGLGFKKPLVMITGVVAGVISAYTFVGLKLLAIAISAVAGAVVAIVLEKIFVALLAAALAAVAGFVVLGAVYKTDFAQGIKHAACQTPVHCWIIVGALVLISVMAGFYLRRSVSALCCATVGTVTVFAGMILLLVYKGADPVGHISSRPSFYSSVFAVMTGFGTFEQLLLYQHREEKPRSKKEPENREQKEAGWRGK